MDFFNLGLAMFYCYSYYKYEVFLQALSIFKIELLLLVSLAQPIYIGLGRALA